MIKIICMNCYNEIVIREDLNDSIDIEISHDKDVYVICRICGEETKIY